MLRGMRFMALLFVFGISGSYIQAQDQSVLKERSEIQDKYKWNLEEMYPDTESWESDFNRIEKEYIPELSSFSGKLTSAGSILKCFHKRDESGRLIEKLYMYIQLKYDLNQADNDVSELKSRAEMLYSKYSTATAFIKPELLSLPEVTLKNYTADPDFAEYKYYLDVILKIKPHTLSKPEEELLAAAGDMAASPEDIFKKLSVADMVFPKIKDDKGKDIQLSPGLYQKILENSDREYRKRAFEGIYSRYDGEKNTFAAVLQANVKKDIFYSRARKYSSSLEASLADEFVPAGVYDNLIKTVNGNLKYLHRYMDIRKRVMKLDKVHVYDMYIPLVNDYEMNISYESAKKMIIEGLAILGPDYMSAFGKGLDSRWIDVYETKNKNTGGYNASCYDAHPYILMNYNDTVDSMLTLAHEMGHAMNSYYINNTQKYVNSGVPIFNAEVASTANEVLMMKYLIANSANDEQRLYFINNFVEMIRGTVYTQVMYSEFEKAIHERLESGEALSVKSLDDMWLSLMKKYFGPDFEPDTLSSLWWARIPHFYWNFYVYKYATSLAASYDIVSRIAEGKAGDEAKKRYIEFLKAGSSDYPIEILKRAGVDMSSPEPVSNLLAEFNSLLDDMEIILKKLGRL